MLGKWTLVYSYNRRSFDQCQDNFFSWLSSRSGFRIRHGWGFGVAFRHTTLGRTPLDEWSGRCIYLYLKIHHSHNRQTSMPPVGFETAIPATVRPQTYALDRAATGKWRDSTVSFCHIMSLYRTMSNYNLNGYHEKVG